LHDCSCIGSQEAVNRRVNFPEEHPEILVRVILYLYTKDYDARRFPQYYEHIAPSSNLQSASDLDIATYADDTCRDSVIKE